MIKVVIQSQCNNTSYQYCKDKYAIQVTHVTFKFLLNQPMSCNVCVFHCMSVCATLLTMIKYMPLTAKITLQITHFLSFTNKSGH